MQLDGYICEWCYAYRPRGFSPARAKKPSSWFTLHQYDGKSATLRDFHWCSEECHYLWLNRWPAEDKDHSGPACYPPISAERAMSNLMNAVRQEKSES